MKMRPLPTVSVLGLLHSENTVGRAGWRCRLWAWRAGLSAGLLMADSITGWRTAVWGQHGLTMTGLWHLWFI